MQKHVILPKIKTNDLVVQELDNELLIYDLATNQACCLNRAAIQVMECCDGQTKADAAAVRLGMPEDMLWGTLERFRHAGLLEDEFGEPLASNTVSRRRMLRQAAALGIAMPIISSLVAPSALAAASCVGTNQPCTGSSSSQCCPGGTCQNTESGPTGFTCVGCVPAGAPCSVGGTACCSGGFCAQVDGVFLCTVIG